MSRNLLGLKDICIYELFCWKIWDSVSINLLFDSKDERLNCCCLFMTCEAEEYLLYWSKNCKVCCYLSSILLSLLNNDSLSYLNWDNKCSMCLLLTAPYWSLFYSSSESILFWAIFTIPISLYLSSISKPDCALIEFTSDCKDVTFFSKFFNSSHIFLF